MRDNLKKEKREDRRDGQKSKKEKREEGDGREMQRVIRNHNSTRIPGGTRAAGFRCNR